MAHPVEKLHQLTEAARAEAPELAQWLERSIQRYLQEGIRLDTALNLDGKAREAFLLARRDDYLRQAWRIVTAEDISPRQRTIRLMQEIRRFEAGPLWERLQHLPEPPEDLSQLRQLLFRALKAGKAPRFRRLQGICESNNQHL